MNSKKDFDLVTPVIFDKKLNKSRIKRLNYIYSDTGKIKHFPPAAQEWYNSIYAYNSNYIKGLPSTDKSLLTLLKGYFSMFINHKELNTEYINILYRRRSSKKIFIGKGELKHTSNKVIITFYVYNTEKISLKREYKRLYKSLYSPKKRYVKTDNGVIYLQKALERYITLDKNGKIVKDIKGDEIISYNRPFTVEEFLNPSKYISTKVNKNYSDALYKQITYYDAYCSIAESFIDDLSTYLKVLSKYYEYLTKLVEIKVLSNREKFLIFMNLVDSLNTYNYPNYDYYKDIAEKTYKENLYKLRYLFKFNSVKFEKPFIVRLTHLVEKLYNKEVEFNIVNLKKMHLNSDILTQAIVLKLKNRKNKFYNIFKSSLNKVKLPNVIRLSDRINKSNKNEYFINKIRNTYINNMFENVKTDQLNNVLLNYFSNANKLEHENSYSQQSISLTNYVFKYLKHLKLAGVRLEAKGRLSRRYTASRSIFQLIWKGGLKNVDSSFKGISAVMLRGDAKSNVEYSMLKSKYRIGAFGIKGWVSSK